MGNCFSDYESRTNTSKTTTTTKPARQKMYKKEELEWKYQLRLRNIPLPNYQNIPLTISHPSFDQIQKDIDRTYPEEPFFTEEKNRQTFKNLLKRVALYLPVLGYTQGMNFIAGYFLLYGMNQQQAFISLVRLLLHPDLMALGLYQDQYPLVALFIRIFWNALKKRQPLLSSKLQDIAVPDQMWVFQWFITFFVYSFPPQYIRQLITFILLHKKFAAVKLALIVMDMIAPSLLKVKGKHQFEDQFIDLNDHLKDYQFCKSTVPLQEWLDKAETISDRQLEIQDLSLNDNLYYSYFVRQKSSKQAHERFIDNLNKEREKYVKAHSSQIDVMSYVRQWGSVCVIERANLQTSKRYQKKMTTSVREPLLASSVFKMTETKKRVAVSSMDKYNNYTMIESKMG